ncbi:MAG: S41 family peptidase [Chlamydiales bacterium]
MIRMILFLLLCLCQELFGVKPPEISDSDVIKILNQMMEAHASYKEFSPPLIGRTLEGYLEELDPIKTYLLEEKIEKWIDPSEETLQTVLDEIQNGTFTTFRSIHNLMIEAIKEREELEKQLEGLDLPQNTSVNEFKNLRWAKTEEELLTRLLRMKALQMHAAERLGDTDSRDRAIQRINKRRIAREEEIAPKDSEDRARFIRAHILKAFASSLDAHTVYFTPNEASQFMIQVQQRLFGIGVQLRDDLNGFTVVKLIEGGPAIQGNRLKIHDRIIAINSESVVGLEITEAVELIRGEEGTPVILTVLRNDQQTLDIEIIRGEVLIKEARIESSKIPFGDGVIAHISLHAFYQDPLHSSAADIYEEIEKIRSDHKIKGIVLDLRLNSGGVLPQAVSVAGLFITKGIIVSIKDNRGVIDHLRDISGKMLYDGPLIILTSKISASAAEIVSQTLQDYGRAIIIGDKHTYGKGTFQTFTLDGSNHGKISPKGEFKVTRGRYYTVSGKSPQLVGVEPDIVVPGFYSKSEIGEMHAKYPLDNDAISENFQDDLSDIPVVERDQLSWLYRFSLQPRIKTYTRLLPQLRKNSEARIAQNKFYQSFLTSLENMENYPEKFDIYNEGDPQLNEAIHIMQDLIVLLKYN